MGAEADRTRIPARDAEIWTTTLKDRRVISIDALDGSKIKLLVGSDCFSVWLRWPRHLLAPRKMVVYKLRLKALSVAGFLAARHSLQVLFRVFHFMNVPAMSAKMLQSSASAISAYACVRLFEKIPELKGTFGDQAFDYWKEFIGDLIKDLSVAIKEGKPELFQSKIRWEREAFQARGLDQRFVAEALTALEEVIAEELPEATSLPVREGIQLALRDFDKTPLGDDRMEAKDPVSRLAANYLLKVLEGDAHGAVQMVVTANEQGLSLEETYGALTLAQSEVGRMWHVAEISIAEEHLITHTTHRAMSVLNFRAPRSEANGKTIVSSAVEGNYHDLGVRAVTDFFEYAGWRVICLGHDTPADEIAQAAKVFEASLVMLSATMGAHLDAARKTIDLVKDVSPDCKILLGGKIFNDFPDLARELGADGCATGINEAVELGNRLCQI